MKLKSTFITHNTGDEQLMISAGGDFNGMVRSNSTAAEIIELLKEDTTLEQIVDKMFEKYDAPREVLYADAKKVVDALLSIGAIDD